MRSQPRTIPILTGTVLSLGLSFACVPLAPAQFRKFPDKRVGEKPAAARGPAIAKSPAFEPGPGVGAAIPGSSPAGPGAAFPRNTWSNPGNRWSNPYPWNAPYWPASVYPPTNTFNSWNPPVFQNSFNNPVFNNGFNFPGNNIGWNNPFNNPWNNNGFNNNPWNNNPWNNGQWNNAFPQAGGFFPPPQANPFVPFGGMPFNNPLLNPAPVVGVGGVNPNPFAANPNPFGINPNPFAVNPNPFAPGGPGAFP